LLQGDNAVLSAEDIRINEAGALIVDKPDCLGQSVFDDSAWWLNQSLARVAPWVTAVSAREGSAFSISLTDQRTFEVSPGGRGEQWRLFQPATEHTHFVFSL
jgi:hypothetical protein